MTDENHAVNRSPHFTLRNLLLLVTIFGIGLGWLTMKMRQAKRQQEAVAKFIELGGSMGYDRDYGRVTSIHFSNYTDLSDDDLAHLEALPDLETLWLNLSRVTDRGLSHLSESPALREVHINANHITDLGIKNLGKLPELDKVVVWGHQTGAQIEKLRAALPDVQVAN